jgi:glucose/arabinose dehydrogenase
LDWLLLPVGRFTSHDGSEWEIGKFELSGNGTFQQQIFATPFLQTPKVFLTIQTNDGDAPLVVRADQVDRFGFQAALFTEELLAGFDLIAETVGYVAVDPAAPSGVVAMGDTVFPYLFEELAVGSALASSAAGYSLIADEERSADGETEHPAEPTNALRLVELTFAQDFALASTDPFSYRIEKVPGGVTLAPGFQLQQLISGNEFDNAVDLAVAPDGRIFVAEEGGRVWIVQNGVRLPTPYLDLSAELFRAEADEGALSAIALDPNFATNRFFYVLYPVEVNGVRFGRLRRYKSFSNNHNLANPATKKDLLGSSASNGLIVDVFHNVGDIQFGTDRTLLVSWGDAAGNDEDDPGQFRSQQFDVPAGKLFRINSKDGKGYSSNPFHTGNNNDWKSKVFALGLRNGFRFAVHPHEGRPYPGAGMPGTIYIGEVGRFLTDEINISRGGENFGWPIFEGDELYRPDGSTIQHTPPVVPLPHPESRSVIGGVIYNGTSWPSEYRDSFLAIDFVTGWLRAFQHNADHSVLTPLEIGTGIKGVTAMAYDQTTDRVYLLGRGSDIIFTSDQGFDGLFYLRYEP